MIIREVLKNDLDSLQELYMHLHETGKQSFCVELEVLWNEIIADNNYHIFVGEIEGKIVSSVTLVTIKNLTRNMKPYALIENVVTHADYRNKGYASKIMNKACEVATCSGCYKIMLLTGSKSNSTLNFYANCGFNCEDKTAFIKWI